MASSSSASDVWSVASDQSDESWQGIRSNMRDAQCQTEPSPFWKTLAQLKEDERLTRDQAQAAAAAAAQSSAQPPAQRPQAGNGKNYFIHLGDRSGIWKTVDDVYTGKKTVQLFRRPIPRCYPFSDQDETYHTAILEHVKYWVGAFLGARNLGSKLSYTENLDWLHPRLRNQLPKRAMFWKLNHKRRKPPERTADTRHYFHGTFCEVVWSILHSEKFMDSVHNSGEGHEASIPGLYASDQFDNAIGHYAWASNTFDDGLFHRFGFVIEVPYETRRREKHRNTEWHEIVFPAEEVYIVGLIVLPDAELQAGTARFYSFDQALETIPNGGAAPPEVRAKDPLRKLDMWKGP